jgi:hypothetical protein
MGVGVGRVSRLGSVIAAATALGLAGYLLVQHLGHSMGDQPRAARQMNVEMPTFVPSCSWPMHVSGRASRDQIGLMRCYLRALSTDNYSGMYQVADLTCACRTRITRADFAHTADARSGVATIRLAPDGYAELDPNFFPVIVTFADGARERVFITEANPITIHAWRLMVGTRLK